MTSFWTEEKIRFLSIASEYVGFNDIIAQNISPYLSENSHVADAGCGLGYLSLAISKFAKTVTAIDVSNEALNVLRANIEKSGIKNITVYEHSAFELNKTDCYDDMICCFFGDTEQMLKIAKKHLNGNLIMIKKDWQTHRFTVNKTALSIPNYDYCLNELKELNINYAAQTFSIDMGQPFHNEDEAVKFFNLNKRDDTAPPIKYTDIQDRLKKTDSVEYPLYLEALNSLGIISVSVRDIPDNI